MNAIKRLLLTKREIRNASSILGSRLNMLKLREGYPLFCCGSVCMLNPYRFDCVLWTIIKAKRAEWVSVQLLLHHLTLSLRSLSCRWFEILVNWTMRRRCLGSRVELDLASVS
jgi:hypothetical protein